MKYYSPRHFRPEEFVPPEIFQKLGNQSLLVMDYRILKTADTIRDVFGKVTINNWFWGGQRRYSGFRHAACVVGAVYSQHRFGRAVDCILDGVSAEEARKAILKNPGRFPYITVLEDRVDWLHVDCRAIAGDGIQLIQP